MAILRKEIGSEASNTLNLVDQAVEGVYQYSKTYTRIGLSANITFFTKVEVAVLVCLEHLVNDKVTFSSKFLGKTKAFTVYPNDFMDGLCLGKGYQTLLRFNSEGYEQTILIINSTSKFFASNLKILEVACPLNTHIQINPWGCLIDDPSKYVRLYEAFEGFTFSPCPTSCLECSSMNPGGCSNCATGFILVNETKCIPTNYGIQK